MKSIQEQIMDAVVKKVGNNCIVEIEDTSEAHLGHKGNPANFATSHFVVHVRCAIFKGMTHVKRHQLVNEALQLFFDLGVHSISIKTYDS